MANIVKQDEFDRQKAYLESYKHNNPPNRDYRYETGFRFKKWMYGHRFCDQTKQNIIKTTFNIHDFTCAERNNADAVAKSDFCKVCPVILPELKLNKDRYLQITNACNADNIYGAFLSTNQTVDTAAFDGRLDMVIVNKFDGNAIQWGEVHAVYPYYRYLTQTYCPYIEFNHEVGHDYFQSRFLPNELMQGVYEFSTEEALDRIREICATLYNESQKVGSTYTYAAIYVRQYTTLAVSFENNKFDPSLNELRQLDVNKKFHQERVLIQHHGLVGLEKYDLGFRFSYKDNNDRHTFKGLADITNNDIYNFVKHPLIVLNLAKDPNIVNVPQPHFAGYYLEILNRGPNKAANLHLPTWSGIQVLDLLPEGVDANGNIMESQGLQFLREQWLGQKFTQLSGPFDLVIDNRKRQAFPDIPLDFDHNIFPLNNNDLLAHFTPGEIESAVAVVKTKLYVNLSWTKEEKIVMDKLARAIEADFLRSQKV